jgi:predicted membrane channel-forming protein YqfA (hemolysin III family)
MESTPLATTVFLGIVAFIVVSSVLAAVQGAPITERPRTLKRWILIALAWLIVTALPTVLGLVSPRGPIPPQVINGTLLVGAIAFALSPGGGRIARVVPNARTDE